MLWETRWAGEREDNPQHRAMLYYHLSLPTGTGHTTHSCMRREGQEGGLMGCTFI